VGGLWGERTRERERESEGDCVFLMCVGERDMDRDSVCVHSRYFMCVQL